MSRPIPKNSIAIYETLLAEWTFSQDQQIV